MSELDDFFKKADPSELREYRALQKRLTQAIKDVEFWGYVNPDTGQPHRPDVLKKKESALKSVKSRIEKIKSSVLSRP